MGSEQQPGQDKEWYVYILRCADNSLYTGITLNINKRLDEHNGLDSKGTSKGAKYTKARRPVTLVYQETSTSRSAASKREHAIKSLTKHEKELLLLAN